MTASALRRSRSRGSTAPSGALVDGAQLRFASALARQLVQNEIPNPLFKAIMNASRAGFLIMSAERRILYANRAMAELTGYSVDELIALPSSDVLTPPENRDRIQLVLREAFAQQAEPHPREREVMRRDGSRVPVWLSAAPLILGDDVLALVVQFVSREAELGALAAAEAQTEALRRANAELAVYRQMVARASDEVLIVQGGRVVVRNGAYYERLGYDVIDRELHTLIPPDQLVVAEAAIAAVEAGNSDGERITFTLTDSAGQPVEMEATLSPIDLNGAAAVVAVARDISERIEFERRQSEQERLEALGRVSAGAAHELANTLGSLTGALSPTSLHELDAAIEHARWLSSGLALIGGQAVGRPEPLSVRRLIDAALAGLAAPLAARVTVEIASPATIKGRQTDLVQALTALLTNALEAGDGPVVVRVTKVLGLPDGAHPVAISADGYCQIEVVDPGAGMSTEVLGRLFEPFFTTKPGRTGMGSSLAYSVIRAHGGQTAVESVEGAGTKLRIYLPRTTYRRGRPATRTAAASSATKRLLLVDDNGALRAVTAAVLKAAGYEVMECASAAAAGEAITAGPRFDVLVVDMRLGDGTGLDVFEGAGGAQSAPPTLFISGYSGDDLSALPASQAWRFMAKPFSRADLLAQLKQLVGTRRIAKTS